MSRSDLRSEVYAIVVPQTVHREGARRMGVPYGDGWAAMSLIT
jgi:hypothetical protein